MVIQICSQRLLTCWHSVLNTGPLPSPGAPNSVDLMTWLGLSDVFHLAEEEELYKLPSCNQNGHGVAPEYLLARQRPLCWFLQNGLHVLAVGGVCALIGRNSLRSRCEGCLCHATSRHTFSGAGLALFCGDSLVPISAVVRWPLQHSCKASSQRYGSVDLLSSNMLCRRFRAAPAPLLEHVLGILLFKACFHTRCAASRLL